MHQLTTVMTSTVMNCRAANVAQKTAPQRSALQAEARALTPTINLPGVVLSHV
jgi:hypothetical protein